MLIPAFVGAPVFFVGHRFTNGTLEPVYDSPNYDTTSISDSPSRMEAYVSEKVPLASGLRPYRINASDLLDQGGPRRVR